MSDANRTLGHTQQVGDQADERLIGVSFNRLCLQPNREHLFEQTDYIALFRIRRNLRWTAEHHALFMHVDSCNPRNQLCYKLQSNLQQYKRYQRRQINVADQWNNAAQWPHQRIV